MEGVRSSCRGLSISAKKALRGAYDEWKDSYATPNGLISSSENPAADVLTYLADAPWLRDLIPSMANTSLFSILDFNDSKLLEEYAFEVAKSGYSPDPGGEGSLDHAVGSGLFLLRYSSFWYWLLKHVHDNAPASLNMATSGFNYDPLNLEESIIPACRAVAFHNIQPSVKGADQIIPRITLHSEPLLYLSVLCDELQIWDRSPAGMEHLDNYREYAKVALDGDDIEIVCNGPRLRAKGRMTIRINSEVRKSFRDKLFNTLDKRLPTWQELIDIEVTTK